MAGKINRISLLNVPVDGSDLDTTLEAIERFLKDLQSVQIVLLTLPKLFKARRNVEMKSCLMRADLVLPVSKAIVRGAHFQKKQKLYRYNPFEFVIRLLTLAEQLDQTVYLLGSHKEFLESAESNLRHSYHSLRIVGRYSGYFDNNTEKDVLLAIRKSSPAILLVGSGVPDHDLWIDRQRKHFNPGISIWVDKCFEVFAGKEKNTSKALFKMGLENLPDILRKPWKIYRLFTYFYFWLLVVIFRIRGL